MKHAAGSYYVSIEVHDPVHACWAGLWFIKDVVEPEKSSNKVWSSNQPSHPYLAPYNESWCFHPALLFFFDSIKTSSLQLLFTLYEKTYRLWLSAYCISLSVWDYLSLPLRDSVFLSAVSLSPCGFLPLSKAACLSSCLWFSISCVLIFSPVQLRRPVRPGG